MGSRSLRVSTEPLNGGGGGGGSGGGSSSSSKLARQPPRCQVEGCSVDLSGAKAYYGRHKVCGMHSKAPLVIVGGIEQRFCQQCSRSESNQLASAYTNFFYANYLLSSWYVVLAWICVDWVLLLVCSAFCSVLIGGWMAFSQIRNLGLLLIKNYFV